MKISRPSESKNRQTGDAGFTMIEIAIAVGVIGFAVVAIIGILPRGMGVQKENREDTIISQDAPYFLNAIRNGEQRTNNGILTNYVESITISNLTTGFVSTNTNPILATGGVNPFLTNDMIIVGLLGTPEYDPRLPLGLLGQTNSVTAIVRAMTGSAIQQNGLNSLTAFRYQLTVEIDPWNYATGYLPNNPPVSAAYTNFMAINLHEVRLRFAWPVLPNGSVGPGRQTYRSLVSSHLEVTTNVFGPNVPLWFFQPNYYTNAL